MRRLIGAVVLVTSLSATPAFADHDYYERDRCYDYDCGEGSDGNTGYHGEGGRSGDMEQGDGSCRNFCNWTIPGDMFPGRGGEER